MIEKESLLKLTIVENLDEDELRIMLKDLKHTRRNIIDNYRLLIILPHNSIETQKKLGLLW